MKYPGPRTTVCTPEYELSTYQWVIIAVNGKLDGEYYEIRLNRHGTPYGIDNQQR